MYGSTLRASDILREFGFGDVKPDQVPVMCMPLPMLEPVLSQKQDCLILRVCWHAPLNLARKHGNAGPILGWPPEDAAVWCGAGKLDAPLDDLAKEELKLNAENIDEIVRLLKGWSHKIPRRDHGRLKK